MGIPDWVIRALLAILLFVVAAFCGYRVGANKTTEVAKPDELARKLQSIGLQEFHWFDEVPWKEYFANAKEVEGFALSARFLLEAQIDSLRAFLRRDGVKFVLLVYDPADEEGLQRFDNHFNEPLGQRLTKIQSVLRGVEALRREKETRATIEVRFVRGPLWFRYTYYKFDNIMLYVPYRLTRFRGPNHIPVFVFGPGDLCTKYLLPDRRDLLVHSKLSGEKQDAA